LTWPQRFSLREPILAYLERCARGFGIDDRVRLNCEVTEAHFDEDRRVWRLIAGGVEREVDVLVSACGQLSVPSYPPIDGIETFRGHMFHSANWDHQHKLAGERVAVVGTGASAIQFIPCIAPEVDRLHVFQRSAPYVMIKPERQYTERHHRLFQRFPLLMAAERLGWYLFTEYGQIGVTRKPAILRPWMALWRWKLRRTVQDPAKRAALTPDYEPGCKRVLFSSDYYEAMARENVEVVPEGVRALTDTGVVSASGQVREVDTIIFATGFAAHGFVAPMKVHGSGGRELTQAWRDGARAYLGMSVAGFPNLFLLYGPNTNLGSGSIVYMLESQARYVVQAVQLLASRPGSALDVRSDTYEVYDSELQHRLAHTVWSTGCHSWYVDENGRNSNNWPGPMREYRRRTRRLEPADYEFLGAARGNGRTHALRFAR
jgi:cation diffusion facilitator CzcD-associated flavoprotein CzcO